MTRDGHFASIASAADLLFASAQRLQAETPFLRQWLAGAAAWLDVGCGSGDHLAALADALPRALGIDPEPSLIARARERHGANTNLRFQEAGADQAPAGPWDRISLLGNVLGCLPDPTAALRNLGRQLSPTGTLLIQVPDRAQLVGGSSRCHVRHSDDGQLIVGKCLHVLEEGGLLDLFLHHLPTDQHEHAWQRLHLFDADSLQACCQAAGLQLDAQRASLSHPTEGSDLVFLTSPART